MQPPLQPPIKVGQIEIRYLIDGTVTGAGSGVFEMTVPPGARVPPPHSHKNNEEVLVVLDGVLRYTVDEETRDLEPGERMWTPKGSVHGFSNPGDRLARALVILTPDIGLEYFRDVSGAMSAPGGPNPKAPTEVMTRYGLVLAAAKPKSEGATP